MVNVTQPSLRLPYGYWVRRVRRASCVSCCNRVYAITYISQTQRICQALRVETLRYSDSPRDIDSLDSDSTHVLVTYWLGIPTTPPQRVVNARGFSRLRPRVRGPSALSCRESRSVSTYPRLPRRAFPVAAQQVRAAYHSQSAAQSSLVAERGPSWAGAPPPIGFATARAERG
jgi:hypothetical protein